MIENNNVELLFEARSENEAFARVVAAAFVTYLDPTIEELQDIKTAVSEAVTNAIVHGYDNGPGKVRMRLKGIQNQVIIEVHDDGLGMENVAKAMEPLYTTKPEQEQDVAAVKCGDGQDVHESQDNGKEGCHVPELMPVPCCGEDTAYGSETTQLLRSFFGEKVFHVANVAFQGFYTKRYTGGKGFEESVLFLHHWQQTVCHQAGRYSHKVGGVYTHA